MIRNAHLYFESFVEGLVEETMRRGHQNPEMIDELVKTAAEFYISAVDTAGSEGAFGRPTESTQQASERLATLCGLHLKLANFGPRALALGAGLTGATGLTENPISDNLSPGVRDALGFGGAGAAALAGISRMRGLSGMRGGLLGAGLGLLGAGAKSVWRGMDESVPVTGFMPGYLTGQQLTNAQNGRPVSLAGTPVGQQLRSYQNQLSEIDRSIAAIRTGAGSSALDRAMAGRQVREMQRMRSQLERSAVNAGARVDSDLARTRNLAAQRAAVVQRAADRRAQDSERITRNISAADGPGFGPAMRDLLNRLTGGYDRANILQGETNDLREQARQLANLQNINLVNSRGAAGVRY